MNADPVYNAKVIYRHDINNELSIVRVKPDNGQIPEFLAGQFTMLGLPPREETESKPDPDHKPKLVRRAYSIASSPREKEFMEFFVVLVQGGKLTPNLWTVDEGGSLWMDDRASGKFTLEAIDTHGKDVIFVSTGTGLAPFVSMLMTYHDSPRWRRLVIINGVRRSIDLGYYELLNDFASHNPSIKYIPVVSRESGESVWNGEQGRVQKVLDPKRFESLTGFPLDPRECHVFLCGNPAMIESVQHQMKEQGFKVHSKKEPGNLHFERYW